MRWKTNGYIHGMEVLSYGGLKFLLVTWGNDEKKAPDKKAVAGLAVDDAKALADYLKTLQ